MIKFNFKSLKGNIYNGIKHDSRLKDIDWSEFFKKDFVIITHNGQFHADDVFCVALMYILYTLSDQGTKNKLPLHMFIDKHVVRMSTIEAAFANVEWLQNSDKNLVVFDLAGGHYDHHCAKNDIPQISSNDFLDTHIMPRDFKQLYKGEQFTDFYSRDYYNLCSFGQLWQHIGRGFNYEFTNLPEQSEDYKELYHKLFDMSVFSKVFKEYVLPISLVDLNGPKNWNSPISRIISNCNREPSFFTGGFNEAISMAVSMLYGEINNVQNQCAILDDVYGKLNNPKSQLSDSEFDRKVKGGGSELPYKSYHVEQLPSNKNGKFNKNDQACGAYASEFLHGKQSYMVIPNGCDVNINLSSLEYIYVRNPDGKITNPLFIFNQNPSTRDGAYRIICGSRIVLDKHYIDKFSIKYKFCHEAGFMITFETIEDAQKFIEWLDSTCDYVDRVNQFV